MSCSYATPEINLILGVALLIKLIGEILKCLECVLTDVKKAKATIYNRKEAAEAEEEEGGEKKKLIVWFTLWAGGIIGPYFFKNDEGYNVTVNGDRYRAMITNFFIPELNIHDVQELWFQQDGTTCHTARATIDLLKDTFGDRLISRLGPVNWPPIIL
ncbi:uncharacterized protein TNCV_2471781 [Trichonephila clavipes]|nr:uncharacterized protein TNCV_2471781 [Trichonephila clavipes]